MAVRAVVVAAVGAAWGPAGASGPAAAAEPTAPAAKTTTPGLEYDRFRRSIEVQVAAKREEQIRGLRRLLSLGADEAELPDLKFRLAELYYEKSQFYFFRQQEAEEAALAAKDPSTRARHAAEQKRLVVESRRWVQAALDLYREIREKYPKYARGPEVLFALGQSYWSQLRYDDAVAAYADLIRNFRESPLVSEAWLAFGEYYFNKGQVHKALKSYEKAATDRRSRVYGFALYKQGWCYYNLAEWKQALRKFRGTVLYSQLSNQLSGENKIALGREAQKDWVRTYSHIGEARQAKFQIADLLGIDDCAGASCRKLLEQLAALWFDEGSFEESAYLYRELIRLAPNQLRNAFFQGRVVDLVSRSGDKRRVIKQTRRLVKIYEQTKAAVTAGSGRDADADDLLEAKLLAESTIRRLAQLWNREAKKTRNDKTYEYAQAMYGDYLKLFSDSRYAYEMRFQLGDVYYKIERFDAAAATYEATVLADPKGKYLQEAANDNILALEEHLKDLGVKRPVVKGADSVPLHPVKKQLVEACDRYLKFVPPKGDARRVAVKYKAGKILYDYNQHDEALRRLGDVVASEPKSEQAEFAANLVVDIHNLRNDWSRLYEAASGYLKNADLIDGRAKLAQELAWFSEYGKFQVVQRLQKRIEKEKGDLRLVAQAYEDFTREFPQSKNADKALFNASVAWDRSGQPERADGLRRQLLKQYPKSPLVADVSIYVAKQAADRADYRVAARAYLRFARKFPTDERARDALYNAAVFYGGLGMVKTANKLRLQYLEDYGRVRGARKEAAAIYWAIAKDLDRARRWRTAAQRYRDYAKEFPTTAEYWEALWREAEIRETKLRQKTEAEKIRRKLLGAYLYMAKRKRPTPDAAARYASQVAFRRVQEDYDAYRKLRLRSPNLRNPKPFQRSLAEKARARTRVIKKYTRVVTRFRQAESTIASLYRIAQAWDIFVTAIERLPCPKRLDRDTCDSLKIRLDEEATPAREAAVKAYQSCVDKSNELNTFTTFSTRCVRALESRAPDRYPKIIEKRLSFQPGLDVPPIERRPLMLDAGRPSIRDSVSARATEGPR